MATRILRNDMSKYLEDVSGKGDLARVCMMWYMVNCGEHFEHVDKLHRLCLVPQGLGVHLQMANSVLNCYAGSSDPTSSPQIRETYSLSPKMSCAPFSSPAELQSAVLAVRSNSVARAMFNHAVMQVPWVRGSKDMRNTLAVNLTTTFHELCPHRGLRRAAELVADVVLGCEKMGF